MSPGDFSVVLAPAELSASPDSLCLSAAELDASVFKAENVTKLFRF